MEQFNLDTWLQDKSRKVVTRSGYNVRILCTDQRGNMPIVALVEFETLDVVQLFYKDGKNESHMEYDLFFAADEEKLNNIIDELKSYLEKTPKEQVEKDWKEIQDWYAQHFTNEKHNEKEELTEFEKRFIELIRFWMSGNTNPEENLIQSRFDAKELLDLARKEIFKDLPKWKKATEYKDFEINEACILNDDIYPIIATNVNIGEYYLELDELKNLPLEE
jgi:hypothetical protein